MNSTQLEVLGRTGDAFRSICLCFLDPDLNFGFKEQTGKSLRLLGFNLFIKIEACWKIEKQQTDLVQPGWQYKAGILLRIWHFFTSKFLFVRLWSCQAMDCYCSFQMGEYIEVFVALSLFYSHCVMAFSLPTFSWAFAVKRQDSSSLFSGGMIWNT